MNDRWARLGEKAERAYSFVISYIFILILAALLLMASLSTTYIDKYEMLYFLPDNPLINFAFAFFMLSIYIYIYHGDMYTGRLHSIVERLEQDDAHFLRVRAVLLWGIWFLVSLWVICTQVPVTADQRSVLLAAAHIAKGDFSPGSPVTYFYIYNNQLGITMVVYLLNRVFGEFNCLAYQLINAAFIISVFKVLTEIGQLFGMSKAKQLLLLVLGVAFVPLVLYSSFIYGTIPGLYFALLAIKNEIIFFRAGGWKEALSSSLSIAFAVLLKMNNLIFMAGMLIYAAVKVFDGKACGKILFSACVIFLFVFQARLPEAAYENISGKELPEGLRTWNWVFLGMQDEERPGWWYDYCEATLAASDYDAEKQEAWVKTDLKARLKELWRDTGSARDFFVRKTASQWNEPSFQSVWISITHLQEVYGQDVVGVDNDWPKLILSPTGNHRLTQYLNYLNFVILSGALLYTVLCRKAEHYFDSLILPMIFIGGFMFHLVWEAKGQYTLPYFVLLLPYTVMGYSEAAGRLVRAGTALKNGGFALSIDRKALAVNLMLFALAVLVLWYLFHGTLGSITGDAAEYMSYLAAHS